ncbi:MAG: hypothetical protein L6Q71_01470 [Planctomycetes bacterium]|nr:hypothetical protein [Planctomycetota bacterium]
MSGDTNKTPAPQIILDLVARFRELEEDCISNASRSSSFTETIGVAL